ncbi:ankyrin repeat domain-containing protein [Agrilutibacter solisilvae]|uniref:Ankyrin repeat domain-containing protein n=1 Tax=Agrilutibacter solisilvae TaxID=2763317 RepID=A0A974Y011_9GAMM|nr:ankyrin repeat domain-containing protein [Lysobacter solisilvae]QSX78912.1 ankyrin repeat domain-containing protein [Lysobacter solisilvae]
MPVPFRHLALLALALATTACEGRPGDREVAQARPMLDAVACHDDEQLMLIGDLLQQAKVAAETASTVNTAAHVETARLHLIRGSACTMTADEQHLRMAESELKIALEEDPAQVDALIQLGRVHTQQGRYDEAAAALDRAGKAGATDAQLHVHRALLQIERRDWQGAQASLERVPPCKPGQQELRVCGGKLAVAARINLYTGMGDRAGTLRAYRESIAAFPESAFMHGNYAQYLLREAGDIDAALDMVGRAMALRGNRQMELTRIMALYARWAQRLEQDPAAAPQARREAEVAGSPEEVMAAAGCTVGGNQALQRMLLAFLRSGLSIDTPGPKGNTALMTAAACGEPDDIRWLLAQGASTSARNAYDANALILAASENRPGNVQALLGKGELEAAAAGEALHVAASRNHTAAARVLIQGGADVNHADERGFTSLMAAAQYDNAELARALLDAGADADARSGEKQWTALMMAQGNGHDAVAQVLREHEAR